MQSKTRIKNYTNIHIVAAKVRHCLTSSKLKPQSLKPYKQSSISKIILHFHYTCICNTCIAPIFLYM